MITAFIAIVCIYAVVCIVLYLYYTIRKCCKGRNDPAIQLMDGNNGYVDYMQL